MVDVTTHLPLDAFSFAKNKIFLLKVVILHAVTFFYYLLCLFEIGYKNSHNS